VSFPVSTGALQHPDRDDGCGLLGWNDSAVTIGGSCHEFLELRLGAEEPTRPGSMSEERISDATSRAARNSVVPRRRAMSATLEPPSSEASTRQVGARP
jgi:hypothetical protein